MRSSSIFAFIVLASAGTIGLYSLNTALSAQPADFGLHEGDLIRAVSANDPDIFIINEFGYKRLFLNPVIFNFYGHLGGFSGVKQVDGATRDAFIKSSFVRNCETNDPEVYTIEVTGNDSGVIHWLNINAENALSLDSNFFKKVFCINNNEFDWYPKGLNYTSLSGADEDFQVPPPVKGLEVDLKINGSDSPVAVDWNSEINATWTSENVTRCAGFEYMKPTNSTITTNDLGTSGSLKLYAKSSLPLIEPQIMVHMICYQTDDKYIEDYILLKITSSSMPSISVMNPNNNYSSRIGQDMIIRWTSPNLPASFKINILITKSDPTSIYQGVYGYIVKDTDNDGSYTWTIGNPVPDYKRGTSTFNLSPGSYRIIMMDKDETVFGGTPEFIIN